MRNPFQTHAKRYPKARIAQAVIDQSLLAFLVGLVAVSLPVIMIVAYLLPFQTCFRDTLSHFYYAPFMGSFFVGMLIFVGAYLIVYVGEDANGDEKTLSTLAGVFAIGVAVFPTSGSGCDAATFAARAFGTFDANGNGAVGAYGYFQMFAVPIGPFEVTTAYLHYGFALALFFILGWFAFFVFTAVDQPQCKADGSLTDVKKLRNAIYRTSGWIIFLCIGLIVAEAIYTALTGKRFGGWVELNLTFWLEAVALWAFGATWLVKSRFHGRFLVDTPPD